MMIPETFLWPLGCLALLGAVHAAFAIEDAALALLRMLTKGTDTWR